MLNISCWRIHPCSTEQAVCTFFSLSVRKGWNDCFNIASNMVPHADPPLLFGGAEIQECLRGYVFCAVTGWRERMIWIFEYHLETMTVIEWWFMNCLMMKSVSCSTKQGGMTVIGLFERDVLYCFRLNHRQWSQTDPSPRSTELWSDCLKGMYSDWTFQLEHARFDSTHWSILCWMNNVIAQFGGTRWPVSCSVHIW